MEERISTTSSTVTDNSSVLCCKCNKPAQTNRTLLRNCKCKGAQYCKPNQTNTQMELYYVTKSKGKTTYKIAYFRKKTLLNIPE